jgi:hypothetical protein
MQNVPKIVRERLNAATPAVNHPDADVLTAFAERSLPELDRTVVLEHLARCGDCRDVVALALPATEPVQTAVRPSPSGWLTGPVLRWAFVTAGVVAIASFGVLYPRRSQLATMDSKSSPRVEVAANEPKKQPLDQLVPAAPAERREKVQSPSVLTDSVDTASVPSEEKKSLAFPVAPAASLPQVGHGSGAGMAPSPLPHGPRVTNQWQQQSAFQYRAPALPRTSTVVKEQASAAPSANMGVPAANEVVEAESGALRLDTQAPSEGRQLQNLASPPQPSVEEYAADRVGKAKPAVTSPVTSSAAPVPSALPTAIGGAVLVSSAALPRWTISASGGLQRSFDQGNTWQEVDVNANTRSFRSATSLEVVAKGSASKVKDAGPALKREAAPVTFRAVAAAGAEVWAGGSALYHSQDAGNHWIRVVPISGGAMLTGDISSLEFPDPQHGRVSTSTAEVWTTTDNGQTWQKQ